MKPTNLLLLDFNPLTNLGSELRRILEPILSPDVQLHQERVEKPSPSYLAELIARIKPPVTLLISQFNPARRVQSLFESLKNQSREPVVIVVTEE